LTIRIQPLKVCLQYIQDKQEVTLTDWFGVHIGPSSDFSDIQAGMSEIRTKSDYPQAPLHVLNAAAADAPHPAIELQPSSPTTDIYI
jgi:hypothetical protein